MKMVESKKIVNFIKNYFKSCPFAKGAVVGMSGGKDSFVVAKLCTLALGNERVFGVIMPNGKMKDLNDAKRECEILGINYKIINIKKSYNNILSLTKKVITRKKLISSVSKINTAPRIRMTLLYSIAGSLDYLVANTSNLSESSIGYTTKWGDNVGDFGPIANYTKTEVCEIGKELGLNNSLIEKAPSDGLTQKTDEDNLGITYDELDSTIRTGKTGNNFQKIKTLYEKSSHKRKGVIKFENKKKNYLIEKGINNGK